MVNREKIGRQFVPVLIYFAFRLRYMKNICRKIFNFYRQTSATGYRELLELERECFLRRTGERLCERGRLRGGGLRRLGGGGDRRLNLGGVRLYGGGRLIFITGGNGERRMGGGRGLGINTGAAVIS